jgi:SAM-dependent methyltransferase
VDDPAYRAFLGRLAAPLLARVPLGAEGLDFGCGPGPALAAMLTEAGRACAVWDPVFAPDPAPLSRAHAFIACTEVVEHLHDPAGVFDLFDRLLAPGGWLGVMTCFQTDDARLAGWWYRKDPTHVVFYREATFRRLAADRGWSCEIPRKDVALMRKP